MKLSTEQAFSSFHFHNSLISFSFSLNTSPLEELFLISGGWLLCVVRRNDAVCARLRRLLLGPLGRILAMGLGNQPLGCRQRSLGRRGWLGSGLGGGLQGRVFQGLGYDGLHARARGGGFWKLGVVHRETVSVERGLWFVCGLAMIWKCDGNGIVLFRERQKKLFHSLWIALFASLNWTILRPSSFWPPFFFFGRLSHRVTQVMFG